MSPLTQSPDKPWRSLEALAGDPAFRASIKNEFPLGAAWLDETESAQFGMRRRHFLQLMGASFALGGLTSCGRPTREKIVPYVTQPESELPGQPSFYATSVSFRGHARGVLVKTDSGRPIKIEGNPDHPSSFGATDAAGQAEILNLYDPDRSRVVKFHGSISTWDDFHEAHRQRRTAEGYAILIEPTSSPTLQRLLEDMPSARIYQHSAISPAPPGQNYDFSVPDIIVAIDDNFLADHPDSLRYIRQFASRRRSGAKTNRLYVIEPTPTLTGAMADHRLAVKPSRIAAICRALEGEIIPLDLREQTFVKRLRDDLENSKSRVLIIGRASPTLLAQSMPTKSVPPTITNFPSLADLTADLKSHRIHSLLILGGNPVYESSGSLEFAAALANAEFTAHLASHEDETSSVCQWHLPEAHLLEVWGDIRAWDGTPSVIQPLIEPLYHGYSAIQVLRPDLDPQKMIRETWQQASVANFETFWKTTLHDGIASASFPAKGPLLEKAPVLPVLQVPKESDAIELDIRADANIRSTAQANNGWLQELPRPLTKLVWDNAALISPMLAKRLGLKSGDVVTFRPSSIEGPVWILPGQADHTVTLHLGYGRRAAGQLGTGIGFDAHHLLGTATVSLESTGKHHEFVTTQHHSVMEGRKLIWQLTPAEIEDASFPERPPAVPDVTLYPSPSQMMTGRYAWAMSIDLSTCVGCNACILACQAENNIPVVGKSEVARGREMHWIRMDRYFAGDPDDPKILYQPVTCQQCEQAPCELVCPVEATVHTADGLNAMVYNRCVGTRYCSNNCPYKVRRFNFFDYRTKGLKSDPRSLQANPDVTVRGRGVMEKCTYCVQRIQRAVITADKESRNVRDGEILTACQQACPAQAIVFGDLHDSTSHVSKLRTDPTAYSLLAELNTRPRTTYLAKIHNPHA